ncbi:centrosomal protein of 120 kDa isoform X2 [Episyrphus balteatus]|uniref:centrosomal protein of 120 kDa isoform X2 n=1 Tax=Episyrphus balteatus TaxID=286459 RepID=UPI0024868EAE|nr:centrosomal protein of 120 kDa isoform X2 [Episyrphus balteatus]
MDNNTEYCIVLHIIEGIRLNINNNDLTLNANLNGVKFEVIGHNTEGATIFHSNCIWECKYDDLKRMKTDNRPIKIECFHKTTKNDSEVLKTIGFILLPIRSLQVVKTPKNLQIKLHWHKLCGLAREWRQAKPELYLSAIITTKELIDAEKLEDFMDPKPIESSDSIYIKPTETSLMLKSQSGIYVNLLEDECRLQIGNNPNDIDTFFLTLTFKNAKNLEELVGGNVNPVFRFHYDIMGSPSDLILVPNTDRVYNINEKITVNFKSSLESLKEYLRRIFYIPVDLYYNENIIGNYTLKLIDLMPSSLELLKGSNVWEVKESFSFATLFDILESPARPVVEYVFCLTYVPAEVQSNRWIPEIIDKKARGDMGDKDDCVELPPTITNVKNSRKVTQTRSISHRINREKEDNPKSSRSDTFINYKLKSQKTINDDVAYEMITELEDWKNKQMSEFLSELKQKEILHLNKLSIEWELQRKALAKSLTDKLDECNRMTESLEITHAQVRSMNLKHLDNERALEKNKYELDKKYTIKFMEIEEKARRIKDEMDYQKKLHDLEYKQLLNEKNMKDQECSKLNEKVKELEEEIKELRKNYVPKEQLVGLLHDLRQQSESFSEIEKSKNFYKHQWAKATREAHSLRLQSLKFQEEKLKQMGSFSCTITRFFTNS